MGEDCCDILRAISAGLRENDPALEGFRVVSIGGVGVCAGAGAVVMGEFAWLEIIGLMVTGNGMGAGVMWKTGEFTGEE